MLYGADKQELTELNECIRLFNENAAASDEKLIATPDPKRRRVILSSWPFFNDMDWTYTYKWGIEGMYNILHAVS